MNKEKSAIILKELHELIPDPKCELNYNNSFELLCAVMLSAQTTDKRVNEITAVLFEKYKNPFELANANLNDVREIIKPLGLVSNKSSNLINIARIIHDEYNGIVPSNLDELTKLPGVGRKTANVVLGEAFRIPAIPVDTHVKRVAYRLGYTKMDDDVLVTENKLMKYIPKEERFIAHHLLLLFGRYYCKAKNPSCDNCKLKEYCRMH